MWIYKVNRPTTPSLDVKGYEVFFTIQTIRPIESAIGVLVLNKRVNGFFF